MTCDFMPFVFIVDFWYDILLQMAICSQPKILLWVVLFGLLCSNDINTTHKKSSDANTYYMIIGKILMS